MNQTITLIILNIILTSCHTIEKEIYPKPNDNSEISCTENGCNGTYKGPEFVLSNDVAHQFSNAMSMAVGNKLKEVYKNGNYRKVNFSKIKMYTVGMGTGQVEYILTIPFMPVKTKCEAYTSFDHVGGWNHAPALEQRKAALSKALMKGHELDISDLKKTPEGLEEYWIQWKNKDTQADCK